MACTGTSTVLAPCVIVGGAMIAVGYNQISKSNEMIDEFQGRMDTMEIDIEKIQKDLEDNKCSTELSGEINKAFSKCVRANRSFKKKLDQEREDLE